MHNRFEWKKIITKDDTQKKFPIQHLAGKKITALNAIGYVSDWDISYYDNDEWHEGNLATTKIPCSIKINEPFVMGFEDGSTFEIQLMDDNICCFSENQLAVTDGEGINHQEVDANLLFKEVLNSRIKKILFIEGIVFVMDNGYALELHYTPYNEFFVELTKKRNPVEKIAAEMLSSRFKVSQIPIEEGHNYSSYFWIQPANESETARYGIEYPLDAEISIEEDYVVDYLRYYLKKYFDPTIYHFCRNPDYGTPEFEWNLEPNLYEYKTVQKMIEEIRRDCELLKKDVFDPGLLEFRKNFIVYSPMLDEDGSKSIECLCEKRYIIIDFYQRLCIQLELMMKYFPDYKCIDFMGP